MNEIIYIPINEVMPGYVKIGRTSTDVQIISATFPRQQTTETTN
ncbi:MAG: hypothetical protein HW383_101 [Candidatus Magasanikbacteria bacterium]|nr:hypothetical protein [Candidatus Magasanikbacteria bacterium]